MRLSIITPYYKTLEYTLKLAEVLEPLYIYNNGRKGSICNE